MSLPQRCKWMSRSTSAALVSLSILTVSHSLATGFFGPKEYLEGGGKNVTAAPEFYWELEVKRLARGYLPKEMPVRTPAVFPPQPPNVSMYSVEEALVRPTKLTADADIADFADALKSGKIKPPDAAAATKQHGAARTALRDGGDLALEFASEFADYHKGADAFSGGPEHYAEARAAWEKLLARPAAERHYRTTWAAFMLGKLALKEKKSDASAWFQKTRALAKEGFADSLGLAADSYGWEGRSEWKQGHPEKAAPLFLTQLALGDESAVESLKAIIPDRGYIEGMLNYGPEPEEMAKWTDAEKKEYARKEAEGVKSAARDPLLRRLITSHILATCTGAYSLGETDTENPANVRIAQWLKTIQAAGIKQTDDAEYLGWAAYQVGDYKTAEHWLELSKGDSPAAHWLRAKLQRRAGKMAEAAQSMVKAWGASDDYTGWRPAPYQVEGGKAVVEPDVENPSKAYANEESWKFTQHLGGDLGGIQLARGEFITALDAFRDSELWEDAAFVAESVLTVDELKAYADSKTKAESEIQKGDGTSYDDAGNQLSLRYLLARKMVRADRYEEAAKYMPAKYQKLLASYAKALKDGANEKLPKGDRAKAWFHAAWIARYEGMEIMGTEVAPDGRRVDGSFPYEDIAGERRTGRYASGWVEEGKTAPTKPISLSASKDEVDRLTTNRPSPDLRFHYRVIAAALAMKAAQLMPDKTEELADVINAAGYWVKDRDEKLANRYWQELTRRAAGTGMGKSLKKKGWFGDPDGPWSNRESKAMSGLVDKADQ